MQTAAGGPLRIKFTPEQIAQFESQATRVPGMNNSGGNRYREEGVQAQQYQEQEAKRREQERLSRMEMRPTLKRKATTAEKLRGKKDEYEQVPQVVGMSGADPLLSLYPEIVGFNGIGALAKTGLWNVTKYVPKTWAGNWGRQYFVGNAFKNSFNGTVPTLASQTTSLLYQPVKQNETGLTSLKFFERPTLSNTQELAGATKWERNFKPKWHVANYPGYQLKGLMKGSLLEKQLSKNGTININQLSAYFNKASQIEKEIANKVLAEKFAGQKTIDYNQFKKAIQDELITYERVPQTKYAKYGMDRLGLTNNVEGQFEEGPLVLAGIPQNVPLQEPLPGIKINTFTFESPKIPIGNNKHYNPTTLGHSRTYTTPDEPNILHVMESQSDWAQKSLGLTKAEKTAIQNIDEQLKTGTPTGFSTLEELQVQKQAILDRAFQRTQGISYQSQHLHDNYLQRQLQENLRYAAENGQTKMRYPTSETAAKIEGYQKVNHTQLNELSNQQMKLGEQFENGEISWEEYDKMIDAINKQKKELFGKEYDPKHQTILKKYADFPKLFQKLFKDQQVRTVTDAKGNTWYEVDVPNGYLSRELQFKQGGKMNILEFLKNGSGIHIKKKNRGKFTSYCGGKVTDECIQKGKNSSNPAIRKRATFAANARKWKHQNGGIIKADEGTKLTFGQKVNNWFNSDLGQVVTNGVSQLFNGIQQANNQNKLNDRLQKWKQAYINSIEPEDFSQQVEQEEEQLKQANPDYNSSPIVTAHKKWFLENQALNSVKQKAAQEADQIINEQLLNNQQQSSGGFNIGNIGSMIQAGFGIFGSLQGNKKQATSV